MAAVCVLAEELDLIVAMNKKISIHHGGFFYGLFFLKAREGFYSNTFVLM